jgi:hypothetical protein
MDVGLNRTRRLSNDTTNRNGHRHLRATLGTLASFMVVLLAASSASAATLNVSGGQLLGASGVTVDGISYNVEFLEGTCIALYGGCDEASDFTFITESAAMLASQALLDQVFLDGGLGNFDTDVDLTFGCTGSTPHCDAITPFAVGVSILTFGIARNEEVAADLVVPSETLARTSNVLFTDNVVYAVWSPIPEPGTALLMGLGLISLSVRNRRKV